MTEGDNKVAEEISNEPQVTPEAQVPEQTDEPIEQATGESSVLQSTQSPTHHDSAPASAVEGGREVSKKILYVGGLHKSVSDEALKDLFSQSGNIQSVKILNDKNRPGFNYAFVEFDNTHSAEAALRSLNGRIVNNSEIRINWAYQSSNINSENPDEPIFNIFVGDLSPEVDDETLTKAFSKFKSLKQAHVMWDMQTSRSRGYGFVSFRDQADAELALQTMNREWISGRAIKCNWASHKHMNDNNNPNHYRNNIRHNRQYRPFNNMMLAPQQIGAQNNGMPNQFAPQQQPNMPHGVAQQVGVGGNMPIGGGNNGVQNNMSLMSPQSYDIVLRQTPSWQTTVYLGNIAHFTQQSDLIPLLQNFGFIVDFKFHPDRGCAFVKFDSHERAALAIVQLAGFTINGRPLKCGWGKDRPPMGQYQNFPRGVPPSMYGQRP